MTVAHHVKAASVLSDHDADTVNTGVLNPYGGLLGNLFALFDINGAVGVRYVFKSALTGNSCRKRKLFIEFVSAYAGQIVFSAVKEQSAHELFNRIYIGYFAGAKLAVELL